VVRGIARDVREVMAQNNKLLDPISIGGAGQVDPARGRFRTVPAPWADPQDVAQTLQTLLSGFTSPSIAKASSTSTWSARHPSERLDLDRLPALTVATRNGVAVPLSQIARLNYEYEEPIIWRRNRDIVLTVRANRRRRAGARCDQGNPAEPAKNQDALPPLYRIDTGGSIEEAPGKWRAGGRVSGHGDRDAVAAMIQLQSFSGWRWYSSPRRLA